ncbi:MAG: hypothetical protein IKH03_01455 [Oscillospiraceae bacterium]|nr:hypothetical protein [Oscillospiraceae bacterium]
MKKTVLLFIVILVLTISTACSGQDGQRSETKELTSAQMDAIQQIIENKGTWKLSFYKNFYGLVDYDLTNWVYFWESDSSIYFLVGINKESNFGGRSVIMQCFRVATDKLRRIEIDSERDKEQLAQWFECGVEIDLQTMSDSELESCLTQAYLKFLNMNPDHSAPPNFEYENDLMDALRQLENAVEKST